MVSKLAAAVNHRRGIGATTNETAATCEQPAPKLAAVHVHRQLPAAVLIPAVLAIYSGPCFSGPAPGVEDLDATTDQQSLGQDFELGSSARRRRGHG